MCVCCDVAEKCETAMQKAKAYECAAYINLSVNIPNLWFFIHISYFISLSQNVTFTDDGWLANQLDFLRDESFRVRFKTHMFFYTYIYTNGRMYGSHCSTHTHTHTHLL